MTIDFKSEISTGKMTPTAALLPTSRHLDDPLIEDLFHFLGRNGNVNMDPPKTQEALPDIKKILEPIGLTFPVIESLIDCLEHSPDDYGRVRDSVFSSRSPLIMSYFDIPYNRSASLEALWVEDIPFPAKFCERYPSRVRPVNVLKRTKGFQNRRSVALFPENFRTKAQIPKNYEIFCFVDKFVERFFDKTLPAIEAFLNLESFPLLRGASRKDITNLSMLWVGLHEYFHNTGPMPITTHFKAKATRSSAAFEELRVDLLATEEAKSKITDALLPNANAQLLAEFILAERLIRYPMEASPYNDYDARSSVAFLNILQGSGHAEVGDQKVILDWANIFSAVANINKSMQEVEALAATFDLELTRVHLKDFIDRNLTDGTNGLFFYEKYRNSSTIIDKGVACFASL